MRNVRHALAIATAAALTTTLVAAPAHAQGVRVDDGADATASLTDIRIVRVRHTDDRLTVKVNFPNLRKKASASMNIYVDTDSGGRGPEYVLGTPLFSGSDYALWRMEDWKFTGNEPVDCRYGMTYMWRRDFVVFSARRGCFDRPNELRIGLRMHDTGDASHPVTDWLRGRRLFTRWLDAGAPNA